MKSSPAFISSLLVVLFLTSLSAGFFNTTYVENQPELEDEPMVAQSHGTHATSPGHVVFGQYISSDNCGHCSKVGGGSDAHHSIKETFPDEYVYVTYMSASYGDTDTARAGNVAPYNWAWSTGGAPDAYFGDRTDKNQGGANAQYTTYDNLFSSGGGMHSTVNDYGMSAAISQNGNVYDISVGYKYKGTGTPASNMKLYAALVDKDCTGYSYSSGIPHGYNCWMAWLTSGDTFKSKSSGTGSAFSSVTVTSTEQFTTWSSVPTNVVPGGINKAIVVAVLMAGNQVSVGGSSAHVYHAVDSTMGPVIDVGVQSLSLTNSNAPNGGYINGDMIDLQATIANNGDEPYLDGGNVKFFYKDGVTKNYVGGSQSLSTFTTSGATQTFTQTIDTTNLPASAYQTTFGVEISGLVDDKYSSNNEGTETVPHDLVPVARKAQVIGSNEISRGDNFLIEAKATVNDAVDLNTSFYTFDVEFSPAGQNQWLGGEEYVVGGDSVYNEGTSNEHRQYLIKPTMEMGAGDYDLRIRAVDSRMQISDWQVTEDAFALMNAVPIVTAEPIPTVKVQTSTKVSIVDNINDAETSLSDLVITSNSPNFVAWHPTTQEIEVYFENIKYVNGQPTATGIEISVSDGIDTAYGTLLFNVIENGQPRWAGVAKQFVDEGSSSSTNLLPFISDTDEQGNPASTDDIVLAIIDNTNPDLLDLDLRGFTLNYATSDDDVNGETTITIRASDGSQYSDQMITIAINPVNDAPRLDLSEYEGLRLKVGTQKVIYLSEILTDIDGSIDDVTVTASNEVPGAARVSFLDNTLTMIWEQEGMQTVTIQVEDRYDSQVYQLIVDVYDSFPLLVGAGPDADVTIEASNVFMFEQPVVTMFLNKDDVTITSLTTTWQLCNGKTGVCSINSVIEHDITQKSLGWTYDPLNGQLSAEGMLHQDYITLAKVVAMSSTGDKFQYQGTTIKYTADEEAPGPESMTEEEVISLIETLDADIKTLKAEIATLEAGSTAHTAATSELADLEADRDEACQYTTCDEAKSAATDVAESGLDTTMILIIVGVVIIALLVGVMIMRGGKGEGVEVVDWANSLPAHDTVANSMYGGTQEIFQQQVAAPTPAAPQVPAGAPPLPPGGLPAGWTMEQWAYYGHQYYDQYNQ